MTKYATIITDACTAIAETKRRAEQQAKGLERAGGAAALLDLFKTLLRDDDEEKPSEDETSNS